MIELLITDDSSLNVVLVTKSIILHNLVPYSLTINNMGDILATVIGYRELRAILILPDNTFTYKIQWYYLMLSNKYYTLDFIPFKRSGCIRTIYQIHIS